MFFESKKKSTEEDIAHIQYEEGYGEARVSFQEIAGTIHLWNSNIFGYKPSKRVIALTHNAQKQMPCAFFSHINKSNHFTSFIDQ